MTSSVFPTSRAACVLDDLQGEPVTPRKAVFWALAAANARDWAYALKWLELAEQNGARAPRTIDRMRREWSLALEREAA